MESNKSLDDSYKLIAAQLCDVQTTHGCVLNTRALKLTLDKVRSRLLAEGMGFLMKTLPRLGKAMDMAFSGHDRLNATHLGFDTQDGDSVLPRFLGEYFSRIFQPDGALLEHPCVTSVEVLRQILFCFYKYEEPYSDEQEQQVVSKFVRTEDDLTTIDEHLKKVRDTLLSCSRPRKWSSSKTHTQADVTRRARHLLWRLFARFDPKDIYPRHGPGAVATKQKQSAKYEWTNVSAKITDVYPFDAYFCASVGHVCDRYQQFSTVDDKSLSAKVILVPKDSRGPRLISCEPVDFQWIQQGLGRAIVDLVEGHPLTRGNVRFTDQEPNRLAAKYGSESGRYATLDLAEASDRVSLELVRLLFPEPLLGHLEACRTSSTELPDGRILELRKFAPMGSALCFPIMALCVWAILTAAADDADTRKSVYVYGDDVIVPTAYAANAIEQLESYGLRVNRDKSCTTGPFRESCGMDAFLGVDVTPVRFRTVWSSLPRPESYTSWISYANSFFDKKYYRTYNLIVGWLQAVYGSIPDDSMSLDVPSLRYVPEYQKPNRTRFNRKLQKLEVKVWNVRSPAHTEEIDGWSMLLRHFAETGSSQTCDSAEKTYWREGPIEGQPAFSVSKYTDRRSSILERRWR